MYKRLIGALSKDQQGSGVLETTIMISVMTMVVLFTMMTYSKFTKFKKHIKLKSDYALIKGEVNSNIDCLSTLKKINLNCDEGDFLEIAESPSRVLIKEGSEGNLDSYTRFQDKYLLRARCDQCISGPTCIHGKRIIIESLLVTKSNVKPVKAIKHPIYKNKDWLNLYKDVPFSCIF